MDGQIFAPAKSALPPSIAVVCLKESGKVVGRYQEESIDSGDIQLSYIL